MEDKKMAKQCMNSSFEKLWYLAAEDDKEETYVFDMNKFSAIQIHNNLSSKSAGTHESLYSTLNEKYDAIACDFLPKLEFLLASESHTPVSVYSLDTFKEEYKVESKVFDLLKIDVDLFTCDTPLGTIFDEFSRLSSMEDNLFAYEVGRIFVEAVMLINNKLVRLIDITLEQWLDLKLGNHKKVDKEIKEGVVTTWLIRSYKKQFEEYIEIKRRLELSNLITIIQLWLYWIRGDDEVLIDDEFSDLEEEDLREGNEIAEIFKIETNIFLFETPLCKEFKEFNNILHIDVDVLTGDLPVFETYADFKNTWYYEWNNEVSWWYEGLEDDDSKEEALKEKAILKGSWGHMNRKGKNFRSWLKESFGNYNELDYELMLKLEEYWLGKKLEEESSEDAWSNYLPNDE
ncbi:hypothetical protein Tco_0348796 [Tanacetum coccineum]